MNNLTMFVIISILAVLLEYSLKFAFEKNLLIIISQKLFNSLLGIKEFQFHKFRVGGFCTFKNHFQINHISFDNFRNAYESIVI